MKALKNVSGSLVALSIQPVGTSWLKAARAAGGDAIDLDPANGNLIGKTEWTLLPNSDTKITNTY